MPFCEKCGKALGEGARFCSGCGAPVDAEARMQQETVNGTEQARTESKILMNDAESADIAKNKGMAVLAYLGILVLVPLFAAKDSPFARYHTNQSLILWIFSIAYGIFSKIITTILDFISWRIAALMGSLLGILGCVFFVFMILGIVNAASGKKKPLPVIGELFSILH